MYIVHRVLSITLMCIVVCVFHVCVAVNIHVCLRSCLCVCIIVHVSVWQCAQARTPNRDPHSGLVPCVTRAVPRTPLCVLNRAFFTQDWHEHHPGIRHHPSVSGIRSLLSPLGSPPPHCVFCHSINTWKVARRNINNNPTTLLCYWTCTLSVPWVVSHNAEGLC